MGKALSVWLKKIRVLRTRYDPETGQTIISGMGELHLEIIIDRLLREFKVNANVGKPQVAYKETVVGVGRAEAIFDQTDRWTRSVCPCYSGSSTFSGGAGKSVCR